ncbi:hypothetical protein BDV33DRAFT_60086 [Aspergillus novoparasiticus]|uniref:Uncharacterized protein n=1 Tax=Aspergillus novoparasiticus TaxID=986946 RepID=A0A5N6E806_9EURO|nr:hypothetical protein BDV33DRAFT_60086 [Aspergillus novoparasiticus]
MNISHYNSNKSRSFRYTSFLHSSITLESTESFTRIFRTLDIITEWGLLCQISIHTCHSNTERVQYISFVKLSGTVMRHGLLQICHNCNKVSVGKTGGN